MRNLITQFRSSAWSPLAVKLSWTALWIITGTFGILLLIEDIPPTRYVWFYIALVYGLWLFSVVAFVILGLFLAWVADSQFPAGIKRVAVIVYSVAIILLVFAFPPRGGWLDLFTPSEWYYLFDDKFVSETMVPIALGILAVMAAFPVAVWLFRWVQEGFRQQL